MIVTNIFAEEIKCRPCPLYGAVPGAKPKMSARVNSAIEDQHCQSDPASSRQAPRILGRIQKRGISEI